MICSIRVEPDRGMPTTKMGTSLSLPDRGRLASRSRVKVPMTVSVHRTRPGSSVGIEKIR